MHNTASIMTAHHFENLKYLLQLNAPVQGNTFARELATVLQRPVHIYWPNKGGPNGNARVYTTVSTPLGPSSFQEVTIL